MGRRARAARDPDQRAQIRVLACRARAQARRAGGAGAHDRGRAHGLRCAGARAARRHPAGPRGTRAVHARQARQLRVRLRRLLRLGPRGDERRDKSALVTDRARYEALVLPHLDAAYNLARWLTRNDHDAEDVLQDAMLRAYRFFGGLRGEARPWLLAIVRNACWTWLRANRPAELAASDEPEADTPGPEAILARELDRRVVNEAIAALPVPYREALVLREL